MNNPMFLPNTPRQQPTGYGPSQPPLYQQQSQQTAAAAAVPAVVQAAASAMNMQALAAAAQQATAAMRAQAQMSSLASAQMSAAGGMNMQALAMAGQTPSYASAGGMNMAALAQAKAKPSAMDMAKLAEAAIPEAQLVTTAGVGDIPGEVFDAVQKQMEERAKKAAEAKQTDAARRMVDPEYAAAKGKEEAVITPEAEAAATAKREKDRSNYAKQVDAARRGIDPEYAAAARTKDTQGTLFKAVPAVMAAQQAGVPGAQAAGNVLQGAMTGAQFGGPAGAAVGASIATALELKKAFTELIDVGGRFGAALAGSDAEGFQRQIVEATKKLPIFGEGLGQLFDITTSINRALVGEAERIKGYNPALAVQSAMLGVERLTRDIDRSYRFQEQYLAAQNAQADMERQFADLQAKYLPVIAKGAEVGMKLLENLIGVAEKQLSAGVALFDALMESPLLRGVQLPESLRAIMATLRQISSNTAREPSAFDATDLTRQLMGSQRGLATSFQEQRDRDQAARQSRERERNRPLFEGL